MDSVFCLVVYDDPGTVYICLKSESRGWETS